VPVELSDALFQKAAGWEAVKRARGYVEQDRVLSSDWQPPLLRGVVQAGETTFRAGLVIHGPVDIENLCTCRDSREWGTICAHSVAVGLHWMQAQSARVPGAPEPGRSAELPLGAILRSGRAERELGAPVHGQGSRPPGRIRLDASGEPAELFILLPPNFVEAAARGKVMLVLEAGRRGGRGPLNALPKEQAFAFSQSDSAIITRVEELAGETPATLLLETERFIPLLPLLKGHPRVTLGRSTAVEISIAPLFPPLKASLEANGEIVVSLRGPFAAPAMLGEEWVWRSPRLQPLGLPAALRGVLQAPVRLPRARVPVFLGQVWPQLAAGGNVEANFKLEDFALEPQAPRFFLELKGGLARLSALLQCVYSGVRRSDDMAALWSAPAERSGDGALAPTESLATNAKAVSRSACHRSPNPRIVTPGVTRDDDESWLPDPASPTRYWTRDLAAERAALARLHRAGFSAPGADGRRQLSGQDAVLNFFAREFPRMQREWEVTLEERLDHSTKQHLERIEPHFLISASGTQWFDLGVVFESSGGEKFSAADIQRLVLGGQGHTRLRNGRTAVFDPGAVEELQEVLLDCAPRQHAEGYRIDSAQAGFLEATLRLRPEWKVQAPAAWRERAARQSGEAELVCPALGELEGVLRPYQKHGVAWLRFLRENGFGGILADEMGLGKTLQVLALLESLRIQERGQPCPRESEPSPQSRGQGCPRSSHLSLVVCPTSLVHNWVAEAAKFTPQLKVLALHGPQRHERFAGIQQADLVVTSYALIRRDAERYAGIEFDTVILDEAQHIKNRQTQNAQAVKIVRARHRLVLTGTPMENSVLDLWSIFDFLMPGYLGSAQDFRERYEVPITREKNPDAQARLSRRLRPFLLRRLKREVAADLPAKLEHVSFCELTDDQRAVYQQVIEASRKEVLDAVGAQGLARSRMVVLNALLRLRQVCCDLRLLGLTAQEDARPTGSSEVRGEMECWSDGVMGTSTDPVSHHSTTPSPHHSITPSLHHSNTPSPHSPPSPSGKLEVFGELLEEVIDGGHRTLVFSQFTRMLALLKESLTTEGIEFCYLDGSTTDRARVVERFQSTPTIPVFLISLKAGGVGLNLTGADTVIHFDPWWNPAVEAQATDRAHRIGQTRVVTSYKLIARDTIEEKILQLQQRKREAIAATLGGEEQLAEALSWEEIQELLAG
jgi:superfamily II DNA or RNA helicase